MKLKNLIAVGLVAAPVATLAGPALNGAGATFPAPILSTLVPRLCYCNW